MTIEGIIFDKDGTLMELESFWSAVARKTAAELSLLCKGDTSLTERLLSSVGVIGNRVLPDSILASGTTAMVANTFGAIVQEAAAAPAGFDAGVWVPEHFLFYMKEQDPCPTCDLQALFRVLKAHRIRIGLFTADEPFSTRCCLEKLGIASSFDFIADQDSGFPPKPAPDALLAFAHRFGLQPGRCVMVGDSLADMEAGRRAGMLTVGVGPSDALAGHADFLFPTPAPLAGLIKKKNAP